jgi:hypothetical protein
LGEASFFGGATFFSVHSREKKSVMMREN